MKKLLLTSVVAGLFLAGCGESLPKEITEHANFKSCQQVEKNLLTIQSSFEKDDRVNFYTKCNQNFTDEMIKEIYNGGDNFKNIVAKMANYRSEYKLGNYKSIDEVLQYYFNVSLAEAQINARSDNSYLGK